MNLKKTKTTENVMEKRQKLFVWPVGVTVKLGCFCFDVKRPS